MSAFIKINEKTYINADQIEAIRQVDIWIYIHTFSGVRTAFPAGTTIEEALEICGIR